MRLPAFLLALGLTTANAADPVWRHEPVEPEEHPDVAYMAAGTGGSFAIIAISVVATLATGDASLASGAGAFAYQPTLAVSALVSYFFGKDFGFRQLSAYLLAGFVGGSALAHGVLMVAPPALRGGGWRASSFLWGAVLSFAAAPTLLELDPFDLRRETFPPHAPATPRGADIVPTVSTAPCAPGPGL